MKNKYSLLIITIIIFPLFFFSSFTLYNTYTYAQQQNNQQQYQYQGKIADYPIIFDTPLYLYEDNQTIEGRYMYQKIGKWLTLKGKINLTNNTFYLDEYDENNNNTGRFIGKYIKTTNSIKITTWFDPSNNKTKLKVLLPIIKLTKLTTTPFQTKKIYTIPEGYEILRFIRSPNSQRYAILLKTNDNKYMMVVDGKEGKKYDYINEDTFTFSPNSQHFAYTAGENCTLMELERDVKCSKYFVVLDNKEGKKYDYVDSYSLTFSPDSKHFAYIAGEDCEEYGKCSKYFVVLDNKEGKKYDNIYYFTFSPDSKNFTYTAKEDNKYFVVLNDQNGEKYEYVTSFTFSSNSQHFAYIAVEPEKELIVLDGKESKKYDKIYSLTFSPDNKYLIYFTKLNNEIWQIVEKL